MSKTNDTSKFDHATLEGHGRLADSELDAVTGGTWGEFINNLWGRPAVDDRFAPHIVFRANPEDL